MPPDLPLTTLPRCPNCGTEATGQWCAGCGQDLIVGKGVILHTLRRQWNRIRHTLFALVARPGVLTAEFRDGQRARSISPWRLTLNVMAIFFLLSFFTGFSVANFHNQDPSGTLERALSSAAQKAGVDQVTFAERANRRFNPIYTVLVSISIASYALLAWLSHLRSRVRGSVHFVFALHIVAWNFILTALYLGVRHILGLSAAFSVRNQQIVFEDLAMLVVTLLWQVSYMVLALRRVYADGWIGATARAVIMIAVGVVVDNAVVFLSLSLSLLSLTAMGL